MHRPSRSIFLACSFTPASAAFVVCFLTSGQAQAAEVSNSQLQVALDTVWVVLAGVLVFFMNAGFGLLEAGFCRAKNTVNILAKNFTVAAFAGISFFLVGFGLMFADGNAFIGWGGFLLTGADNSPMMNEAYEGIFSSLNWAGIPLNAKFFFQACFAMAAASIVSGVVAERIKFSVFVIFSLFLVGVVYAISGHWVWGGGWLQGLGFSDFAGSTQVHSVGGFAALVGAYLLGPRRDRYDRKGRIRAIPGHSMALATTGAFVLWIGWFGFNAGSTMAADPQAISHIVTTTLLASLSGIIGAIIFSYAQVKAFDLGMMINGCLAGLVAITAPCVSVSPGSALLIGLVGGGLVVGGTRLVAIIKIDDPVGAIPVHLLGGIWGTLSIGFFAETRFGAESQGLLFGGSFKLLGIQLLGVVAVGALVMSTSFFAWYLLKKTIGLRVGEEEEFIGLDLSEMRMRAYPGDGAGGLQTMEAPLPEKDPTPVLTPATAEE